MGRCLAHRIESIMVYRLSRLILLASVAFAILRLGNLLRPAESGPPWQLVLVAAFLMGSAITWLVVNARLTTMSYYTANLLGYILAALRIMAPGTLTFGIIPSSATRQVLLDELAFAVELIRFGSTPVLPVRGLIAVIALAFWIFGALGTWGLTSRRPAWALLPPLMLSLQLATIDRVPSPQAWTITFASLVALSLLAIAVDERRLGTGRLRDRHGGARARTGLSVPAVALVAMVAAAVIGSTTVAGLVPGSGLLEWRSRSGLGGGIYGGVSYNLFVSTVQSDLLSLGDEPVFVAQVAGPIEPGSLYWKLISLEKYDGTNWYPDDQGFTRPAGSLGYGSDELAYQGNTVSVAQVVQIRSLRMNYLPALRGVTALASDNDLLDESFSVREDGSLRFDARTFEGLTYSIESQVPNDSIAALATGVDGRLSPLFEAAGEAGLFSAIAVPDSGGSRPANLGDYTELPPDMDSRILLLAQQITGTATTPFERAVMLESFYRNPVEFTYSVDIDAGHSANNLADWLFEPDSPNFRTGYCEQFATGMAVMARELGIPSRVSLGFTPGDVDEDGLVIVRQRNAHAWVELWLDGHGWVQFDPTPRSDGVNPATQLGFDPRTVSLPAGDPNDPSPDPNESRLSIEDILAAINDAPDPSPVVPLAGRSGPITVPNAAWWILGALALIGALPAVKLLRRRGRRRDALRGDIRAAWADIFDRLVDLRHAVAGHLTPVELARNTEPSLLPLAMAYGADTYGPPRENPDGATQRNAELFAHADGWIKARHSRSERLKALWSLRSART